MVDFRAKLQDMRKAEAEAKLQAKLEKAIRKDSNPSMVPVAKTKKEKLEEPPPPDIREFDIPSKDRLALTRLVVQHAALGLTERTVKKEKKSIADKIKPLCSENSLTKFMVDGNRVNYFSCPSTRIDKSLLLASGVSPLIIAKCTITKSSYRVLVTPPNGEAVELEGDEE